MDGYRDKLQKTKHSSINWGSFLAFIQHAVEADLGRVIGRDGTAFLNAMTPLGRHGSPAEIARSVLYHAFDLSSFTTGATPMVDGGMSA